MKTPEERSTAREALEISKYFAKREEENETVKSVPLIESKESAETQMAAVQMKKTVSLLLRSERALSERA